MDTPYAGPQLLDDLPDGVVAADAAGAVTFTNTCAQRMLGLSGTAVGEPLGDVVALQDQEGVDWISVNDPYGGLSTRSALTEQSWLAPDGTEVLVAGRLIRSRPGRPVERVTLVLRSARGRSRLDRDRSDLVAAVAHELRSPLTGVRGFVTTLLSKWDRLNDEQKKLMLATVNADAERLARLITELLDVARIDTGRLPLYPREVGIVPAVARVLDSARMATSRTLRQEYADPEAIVFADPDKLIQVLINLVDNAIRHGEGTVTVTTTVVPGGVRVSVDDEGEGIAETIRRRVFTKFWKHGTRGGTGLGMYLVHGLVAAHAGTVEITDAPGSGARVVLFWPSEDRRTH
ncbi:MAG: ATP-binding protein [Actinomycetota bacterium]|nr:ATP-binding protein [Actinomycetota bacterium]